MRLLGWAPGKSFWARVAEGVVIIVIGAAVLTLISAFWPAAKEFFESLLHSMWRYLVEFALLQLSLGYVLPIALGAAIGGWLLRGWTAPIHSEIAEVDRATSGSSPPLVAVELSDPEVRALRVFAKADVSAMYAGELRALLGTGNLEAEEVVTGLIKRGFLSRFTDLQGGANIALEDAGRKWISADRKK